MMKVWPVIMLIVMVQVVKISGNIVPQYVVLSRIDMVCLIQRVTFGNGVKIGMITTKTPGCCREGFNLAILPTCGWFPVSAVFIRLQVQFQWGPMCVRIELIASEPTRSVSLLRVRYYRTAFNRCNNDRPLISANSDLCCPSLYSSQALKRW